MKIYQIVSSASNVPLAEVRTDGNSVHFVVDNTEGQLPEDVKGSFQRLKQIVKTSHHLSMKEPEGPTANLLRYVLDNGDVVEITTDGATCMLNGKLLDEKAKTELFNAIRSRQINVSLRPSQPVPVMPSPKKKPEPKVEDEQHTRSMLSLFADMHEKQKQLEQSYGPQGDELIDGTDYSYSDSPEDSRQFAYFMKYGTGGRRA